ncbi:hypothetical protein AGLY_016655 [Aphis glycines]|uniref:Uncharacterized protein n=1 Tax=Aphis glycines TaxID=307491 RepID=A0A6G0SYJ0_APHGL|nr:hypothetical protein AGLY_016655 [Aphis glycines]
MAKMRVRLCTQVLSASMAKAMQFYRNNGCLQLKGSTETSDFTLYWNNVFNFENALSYLNWWEDEMKIKKIDPKDFFTMTTAQGLRVTIQSTIDLSKYLLEEGGFEYVLTGKMCQDPLEKFFGIIRQSTDPNDHPTTPTFLHLYKMLSIYSVLKPPKHGNYILIEEGIWEPCQVLPPMDSYDEHTSIRDCVVYYVCGNEHPAAKLITLKSRGNLLYPNTYLFEFLSKVESSFAKHCTSYNVFERVIDEVVESKFELKYTCAEHQLEVATDILVYFIQMRLRQYIYQENLKLQKISREKKKLSKLYNT